MMGLVIRGGVKPEAANPVNRVLIRAVSAGDRDSCLRHRWRDDRRRAAQSCRSRSSRGTRLGSEFMPPLERGRDHGHAVALPGVGTAEAKVILQQRDAALARIPEVRMVLGKIGRAETATDMAPMSMIETIAILKDKSEWRAGRDVRFDRRRGEQHGARRRASRNMWSMPIKNRLDMLATGIKTPVGIKIFGPSLDTLGRDRRSRSKACCPRCRARIRVFAERAVGGEYLDITVDRDAAARYGMTTGDVQMALATAASAAWMSDK